MRIYSSGEAAKRLGVSRDSLFGALRNGAPDAESRIGNRRAFTDAEIEKLAEWYERRRLLRDGFLHKMGER